MNLVENPFIAPQRRVWMTLERDFRKRGAALLHQQCGLWGFDVRREVGGVRRNALLELGFERTPPPTDVSGATTYSRAEKNRTQITLWGFGMHFGDQNGGIFLSRFAFGPRYFNGGAPRHAWMPAQLLETHRAPCRATECLSALAYFRGAMQWIAAYEREIEVQFGAQYRAETLQFWMKSKANSELLTPDIARDWENLANDCQAQFYCRSLGQNHRLSRADLKSSARLAQAIT